MKMISRDLPKGTPLVVNGAVHGLFQCLVHVIEYIKEDDSYYLEVAKDFVNVEGQKFLKGMEIFVERLSLFDAEMIPNEWPEYIREFLEEPPSLNGVKKDVDHHDIVQEALLMMETKLRRSKRKEDKEKLNVLQKEMDIILLRLKG